YLYGRGRIEAARRPLWRRACGGRRLEAHRHFARVISSSNRVAGSRTPVRRIEGPGIGAKGQLITRPCPSWHCAWNPPTAVVGWLMWSDSSSKSDRMRGSSAAERLLILAVCFSSRTDEACDSQSRQRRLSRRDQPLPQSSLTRLGGFPTLPPCPKAHG